MNAAAREQFQEPRAARRGSRKNRNNIAVSCPVMAEGGSVTVTLELAPALPAPAEAIPSQQARPSLVVSLTGGCDAPLEALKAAPADHDIRCNPCDEAIVQLLLARTRRGGVLFVTEAVTPGTLRLG
jgi:hypothetical protein